MRNSSHFRKQFPKTRISRRERDRRRREEGIASSYHIATLLNPLALVCCLAVEPAMQEPLCNARCISYIDISGTGFSNSALVIRRLKRKRLHEGLG
jgi:hypothetical protein